MAAKKSFKNNPALSFISAAEAEQTEEAQQGFVVPKGYRLMPICKTERMQLLVTPEFKLAVKRAAASQGISMNEFMNNVIEEYLKGQGLL